MLLLTGATLVVVTWTISLVALALMGLPISALTHDRAMSWADVRRGLWWGMTVATIVVMLLANLVALNSPVTLAVLASLTLAGALASVALVRSRGWAVEWKWSSSFIWVFPLAVIPTMYLAVAALGPVTNFDSGLYHLNAIAHAAEFSAIPGLANLYAPLGYANAGFPLAAALESTPWSGDGFRLLNGLIITMVGADLVIRWGNRRRDAGDFGLLVGFVVLIVPMVALADYWVTSPSQDSAVFAGTVAASAMIMSAVSRERLWLAEMSAVGALGISLVLLRPTMGAFLVGILLVTLMLGVRRRVGWTKWRRWLLVAGITGVLAAVAQVVRDYLLSGWLLYPLSIVSFDVPWLASDPEGIRVPTLGYHRDPANLWQAAEGFGWVPAWIGRLPTQWEFWLVLLLTGTAAAAVIVGRFSEAVLRLRGMLVAMVPSLLMTIIWWVATPPSFRFAWGPVFTLLTIPLGWMLWRLVGHRAGREQRHHVTWILAAAAIPVLAVTAYSSAARLDVGAITAERQWRAGITLTYAVAPIPEPMTSSVGLSRGLVVEVPADTDMCWGAFPLCTPATDGRVGYLIPTEGLVGGLSVG